MAARRLPTPSISHDRRAESHDAGALPGLLRSSWCAGMASFAGPVRRNSELFSRVKSLPVLLTSDGFGVADLPTDLYEVRRDECRLPEKGDLCQDPL